ncbi:MAG: bifunctional UDP-N-acetylglucosamine diphosphorylase/glucosamine-1-phosphate N-acetyltransferase GlmU [Thermoleophilaceae bacterium]
MTERPTVLIMAAGQGTRMRSQLPKVLHPVCGQAMLGWVIGAAKQAGAGRIVCVTRPGDGVAAALPDGVESAEQREGEGTGAAVLAARDALAESETAVILSGDHPLVSSDLIAGLVERHAADGAAATLLTTTQLDPTAYGRVVRAADGSVERIVETKDTAGVSAEELAIREINIGTYAFAGPALLDALDRVDLADGERYLTGAVPILSAAGERISAHTTDDTSSAMGVNTRADLMAVARVAQQRILDAHAQAGVGFAAPETACVDVGVEIAPDATIETGVTLRGKTTIGAGSAIGPHTTAIDATIGDRASVPHSYLLECVVGDEASVGPFAYLRPGAKIGPRAKVGTFVEVKNSDVGPGAKVPHLSYIGDADVGEGANVGAGNVTANYDGRDKHRTTIGAGARTGVNTSFIAPVSVGDGAYTGAGSVITDDVPERALGISRPEQRNVEGYADKIEKEPGE